MRTKRPVNLDLTKFHFPPMAIVSICHRISGFILFLCMPLLFYLLRQTILSEVSFWAVRQLLMHNHWLKVIVWIALSATLFHLLAGIRHLIMDFGFGESVHKARITAYMVFVISSTSIVLTGVWIW